MEEETETVQTEATITTENTTDFHDEMRAEINAARLSHEKVRISKHDLVLFKWFIDEINENSKVETDPEIQDMQRRIVRILTRFLEAEEEKPAS